MYFFMIQLLSMGENKKFNPTKLLIINPNYTSSVP